MFYCNFLHSTFETICETNDFREPKTSNIKRQFNPFIQLASKRSRRSTFQPQSLNLIKTTCYRTPLPSKHNPIWRTSKQMRKQIRANKAAWRSQLKLRLFGRAPPLCGGIFDLVGFFEICGPN